MEVHCAWCEREGVPSKMHEVEGPSDEVSHGICELHQQRMLDEISKLRGAANPRRKRKRRHRRRG